MERKLIKMVKLNNKAPNFKAQSTSNKAYSLNDSKGKYVVHIFIQKMTLLDVL